MKNLKSFEEFINESTKEKVEPWWDEKNEILKDKKGWMSKNLEVGKPAKFKTEDGKMMDVELDSPKRGGDLKYYVYHNSGKKDDDGNTIAMKIQWGSPGMSVKNDNPPSAASFWARQQCDLKKKMDPTKAGFWACYAPSLFAKELDLVSDNPW